MKYSSLSHCVQAFALFSAPAVAQFYPAPGSPLRGGMNPQTVAVGDMNSDGRRDIVIADWTGGTLFVMLAQPGGYAPAPGSPFAAGVNPVGLVLGDWNRDGRLDAAVSNYSSVNVTVYLGDGTGRLTAAPGSPVATGNNPSLRSVADLNGDGRLDLVVCNYGDGTVSVLLGNGAGRFSGAPASSYRVGSGPLGSAVADFNGDGRPDIAVTNRNSNDVSFVLGGPTGFRVSPRNLGVAAGPVSVVARDFNGDGRADLAIANHFANKISVFLGDGRLGFAAAPGSPFATGNGPNQIKAADFDGDGELDLAAPEFLGTAVALLRGNGRGRFTPFAGSPVTTGNAPVSIATPDLNGDGRSDLVAANFYGGDIVVLLAGRPPGPAPSGSLISGVSVTALGNPQAFAIRDFNRDGLADLAVADWTGGRVLVLLQQVGGVFAAALGSPLSVGTNPDSVIVADYNSDGISDLAIGNYSSGNVHVYLGGAGGTFTAAPGSPQGVGNQPMLRVAPDVNGDGRADLVVNNYGSNTVSILLSNGTGQFTEAPGSPHTVGSGPLGTGTADFNRDGRVDLLIANRNSNNLTLLLGSGGGAFSNGGTIAAGTGPVSIATGDFNRDGFVDAAVANTAGDNVSIFRGNGVGGFTAAGLLAGGSGVNGVLAVDLDGDGNLDLVSPNMNSANLSIYMGSSTGAFASAPGGSIPTGGVLPVFAAAGDVTGDRRIDLLVANFSSGTIAVLNGSTTPTIVAISAPGQGAIVQASQPIVLRATVTASASASLLVLPIGSVTFRDGSITLGSAPISGGGAQLNLAGLAPGTHRLTAAYSGDPRSGASTSTEVTVTAQ